MQNHLVVASTGHTKSPSSSQLPEIFEEPNYQTIPDAIAQSTALTSSLNTHQPPSMSPLTADPNYDSVSIGPPAAVPQPTGMYQVQGHQW